MKLPFFSNPSDDSSNPLWEEKRRLEAAKRKMLRNHLAARGIKSSRVLAAMEKVPREEFVATRQRLNAYNDSPLEIGWGQTISQPYMVAAMSELLEIEPGERVLEIGAGSGYQTAILQELGAHVFSVELVPELFETMRQRLFNLGYENFQASCHDGNWGWPAFAPFDAILVAAAAPSLPPGLEDQLQYGGRIVAPVGASESEQLLMRWLRTPDGLAEETIMPVRFVPLLDPDFDDLQ